jgi:preprotein translocase SecE subunit
MASVTNNGEKSMATDEGPEDELHDEKQPAYKAPEPKPAPSGGGFFTIYKKGQGYWTRISTAGGVALLLAFTAFFLHSRLPVLVSSLEAKPRALTGVVTGVVVLGALLAWRLMNKPDNVDFLIATDSEMKKVNWTSQKELVGSTKVVIFFMLIIASVLFLIDVLFGYFFWLITVLKAKPF